jgi:hypothetical protein
MLLVAGTVIARFGAIVGRQSSITMLDVRIVGARGQTQNDIIGTVIRRGMMANRLQILLFFGRVCARGSNSVIHRERTIIDARRGW